jgi:hypothetical protein
MVVVPIVLPLALVISPSVVAPSQRPERQASGKGQGQGRDNE